MTTFSQLNWHIKNNADEVATATVNYIIECANHAIQDHGCFRLVLAGGTTPEKAYQMLAQLNIDWSAWKFFYGDERCLPADDSERNSIMAKRSWLDHIAVNENQHFPVPAERGAELAATQYLTSIRNELPFDLVLLGMGEDGHTASLFPGHPWQADAEVIAVHNSPKPPADRVSLGPAILHSARKRLFIITGNNKADAIEQWRKNADLPIKLTARPGDDVFIDKPAWEKPKL